MTEIWKSITNYESLYEVSSHGRVRNLSGRIISQNLVGRPRVYFDVSLYKNGERKHMRVNRLVAIAFLDEPDSVLKNEVNHFDCDPQNNLLDNLEWVSRRENEQHKKFMRICFAMERDVSESEIIMKGY